MKPDSPSPSDGTPLHPRHRAKLENLAKDTTEADLWEFGDEAEEPAPITSPRTELPGKTAAPSARPGPSAGDDADPAPTKLIPRKKVRRSGKTIDAPEAVANDIDDPDEPTDLGEWDEISDPEPAPAPPEAPEPSPATASEPAPGDPGPESPAPAPATPLADKFSFSRKELLRVGIFALLLLAGGIFFLAASLGKLPTEAEEAAPDFPVKGKFLTASSAQTYWREPVLTGDNPDVVRRGTSLIPVVELTTTGKPAAVRVFFRDGDGRAVGDTISLATSPGAPLVIPATAGFDDPGMHAAYRTGDTKPWTVEIFEGPSERAAGTEFSPLFKITIATARR